MIHVMNKKIVNKNTKIIVFGRLESVVMDDNIMDAIRNQYESNEKINSDVLINSAYDNEETNTTENFVTEETNENEED